MASMPIVVVGASSGGIEALRVVVAGLPRDFPAPVCVVLHTSPESPGVLPFILNRAGSLPAAMAATGERLHPERIYVAPPGSPSADRARTRPTDEGPEGEPISTGD
jgi:two-component system chemotaxis response regulator CheB